MVLDDLVRERRDLTRASPLTGRLSSGPNGRLPTVQVVCPQAAGSPRASYNLKPPGPKVGLRRNSSEGRHGESAQCPFTVSRGTGQKDFV